MSLTVQPAQLDSRKGELLNVLGRNLGEWDHSLRFQWLYHENPAGPTWAWFACEGSSNRVIGVASVFSRRMWVTGKEMHCGQVGDFAIDATHRSLGPAVLLQRATFEPVDRGELAFCYDCPPHEAGMSTFRRMQMRANCETRRYARPLRTERLIEKSLGRNLFSRCVMAAGNAALRVMTRNRVIDGRLEISIHSSRFGEEFTALDERARSASAICYRRRSVDLNWRYRDDPLNKYEVVTARVHGELEGFAIFSVSGQDAYLVDVCTIDTQRVAPELIEAVASRCSRDGLQTLQAIVSEASELSEVLERTRFRYRSAGPRVVAYAQTKSDFSALLTESARWQFQRAELLA